MCRAVDKMPTSQIQPAAFFLNKALLEHWHAHSLHIVYNSFCAKELSSCEKLYAIKFQNNDFILAIFKNNNMY